MEGPSRASSTANLAKTEAMQNSGHACIDNADATAKKRAINNPFFPEISENKISKFNSERKFDERLENSICQLDTKNVDSPGTYDREQRPVNPSAAALCSVQLPIASAAHSYSAVNTAITAYNVVNSAFVSPPSRAGFQTFSSNDSCEIQHDKSAGGSKTVKSEHMDESDRIKALETLNSYGESSASTTDATKKIGKHCENNFDQHDEISSRNASFKISGPSAKEEKCAQQGEDKDGSFTSALVETQKRMSQPHKSEVEMARKKLTSKRPSMSVLKKTGEPFVQDSFCSDMTRLSRSHNCRECRLKQPRTSSDGVSDHAIASDNDIYCRFTSFRRLRFTRSGVLVEAGFCDPYTDSNAEDLSLWLPNQPATASSNRRRMEPGLARLLVTHVGAQFCRLVEQEESARRCHKGPPNIAWKRVVDGCREMCDVCNTTLFNTHWVCSKCGFAVCIDCYSIRSSENENDIPDDPRWLPCNSRQSHDVSKLMLTQIIAGDALAMLNRKLHAVRRMAGLASCQCPEAQRQQKLSVNNVSRETNSVGPTLSSLQSDDSENDDTDSDSEDGADREASLRQLLGVAASTKKSHPSDDRPISKAVTSIVIEEPNSAITADQRTGGAGIRVMTLAESRLSYPNVRHSWLCDGKLLRLQSCDCAESVRLFRDQWRHGQPVLCSGVGERLRADLWSVESFVRDFGHICHDLINCNSGNIVPNQPMRRFWDGFERIGERLLDDTGQPMILKLKDWPPGEDFADMMPQRFADLMSVLPMPEYTHRDGRLNLASCLPDTFVRPDLGPKMYIAYGCALNPDRASTNLHLDISDAVNIMVHVTIPVDQDDNGASALRAIEDAGCDPLTKQRVIDERPGALWHIYRAADSDKIRDLLNRVALERGMRLDRNHDPIHDQSWYLDDGLRRRLYVEYGVEGFPIVQCSGDAVFIPAGAPHQVRNLHSCIKVAEDFVSPENVGHCFDLTQEFRALSDTHTNHEDKLQIKNIVYHAMKEAVSCLPYQDDDTSDGNVNEVTAVSC